VFLLNPANRDFIEGKARFSVGDSSRAASVTGTISKIALIAGAFATLGGMGGYFYQEHAKANLLASVKSVTATVSGCEGPGRYQHIRFHYQVDGRPYDENAYLRRSIFVGGSGLIDACAGGPVKLNYLAGEPGRWAIAPLSPITKEELQNDMDEPYLVAGPFLLVIAGIFWLTAFALRRRHARYERLRDFGTILGAQLVKLKQDDGEGSAYNLICTYLFRNPQGIDITGSSGGFQGELKKKDFPAPGTKLLVLYVDDKLHEAL
jgi:hypothetical protein